MSDSLGVGGQVQVGWDDHTIVPPRGGVDGVKARIDWLSKVEPGAEVVYSNPRTERQRLEWLLAEREELLAEIKDGHRWMKALADMTTDPGMGTLAWLYRNGEPRRG